MVIRRKLNSLQEHWSHGGIYRLWQKSCERLLYFFYPILSPIIFVKLKVSIFVGYWANVTYPRSFSEKIVHSKLFYPNPLASQITDKFRVRDYVSKKASSEILNELYWVGNDPDRIPFDSLPKSFVVKANHGAGLNIFVKDGADLAKDLVRQEARFWMEMTYSALTRSYETQYDGIDPVILIERFMTDDHYDHPLDYKFFCFHGEPWFIQVDIDRFGHHKRNIYDAAWRLAPFELHYRNGRDIPRPNKLDEMLEIARKLSADFEFCRVDLYLLNDEQILFGEITLYPGGGFERFFPRQWDFKLGELWHLGCGPVGETGDGAK